MLETRVGALELATPLLTGSGTFGHDGAAAAAFLRPGDLGALVLKTVTPEPRPGNPVPRMVETPCGLLNSIGLENRGIEAFLRTAPAELAKVRVPVVANAGGHTLEEFRAMVRAFDGMEGVAAIELNLSCPNVQGGSLPFSTTPEAVSEVVRVCRMESDKPLWAKLSPNVTRIAPLAQAAEAAGADALTVCNTLLGLAVDWRRRRPVLGAGYGGLSGPAVRPVAVRLVWETSQAVTIPIVASGGAASADDVLQFVVAGACAVQVGTAGFRRPDLITRIATELRALLADEGLQLRELIGSLQWPRPATVAAEG